MRIYEQAILTDSSKESYLLNPISGIPIATYSSNAYKALRELLVKTDFGTGRNQKLKASTSKYQSQSKPSIQYREKQETLVPYTRSESHSARPLWSDFERDTCLCHPHQITDRPHSTLECNNLDMDKFRSHLDGDSERLLAFKRLRMHRNAFKGPLVSSTSNRRSGSSNPNKPSKNVIFRMTGSVPISPNTDQLRTLRRIDHRLQASTAAYAKQRASPKTYGQAITPETARKRILNEDFETTSKVVSSKR
jgi:hypothetical protein